MDRQELLKEIEVTSIEATLNLRIIEDIHSYFSSNKHDFTRDDQKFEQLNEAQEAYRAARKKLKQLMDIYNGLK